MKKLKVVGYTFLIVILVCCTFWVVVGLIPPKISVQNNPFISSDRVMVAAHRGGADNNPENTMKAFKSAVDNYNVDILESDLYLTSDGYLVFNHDSYIDETCNIYPELTQDEVKDLIDDKSKRHYIKDMTLEQLRQYNFGYYFEDENGDRPYKDVIKFKDEGLQILEASEMFSTFYKYKKDLLFIVEIKDDGERGKLATDTLINMLEENFTAYKNRIVIGTFHDEIEEYLAINYPNFFRGASTGAAAKFIVSEMFDLNNLCKAGFACLQIPMEYDLKVGKTKISLNLAKKEYINKAHKRNIAVQYWTINDEEEMKSLIDLGCDAIMTDNPKLLNEVLQNAS